MDLAGEDHGGGPRTVLALHCGLGTGRSWRGLAKRLGDRITIRALDLPGHGASPDWDGLGDITDVTVDAVEPVFLALSEDGPVDLAGHSYGGVVLLMLALRHPGRVRSLMLIEPVLMKALPPEEHAAQIARMRPFGEALAAGDRQAAGRLFLELFGGGVRFDDLPVPVREAMATRLPLILASHPVVEDDRPGLTSAETLGRLGAPVLLVEGTRSLLIHPMINEALAARLPDARRAVIAEAAHMIPDSHPDALAETYGAFLAET